MFEKFLKGDSLAECYAAVGEVANQWLDVLYSKGGDVDDDELMELISQNKTMSQTLEDYGTAKVCDERENRKCRRCRRCTGRRCYYSLPKHMTMFQTLEDFGAAKVCDERIPFFVLPLSTPLPWLLLKELRALLCYIYTSNPCPETVPLCVAVANYLATMFI